MNPTMSRKVLEDEIPWLLVPVQTKVREFTGRVLLAAVAAERGWGTVLGTHVALRPALRRFPPSVVLDYSVTFRFAELFRRYRGFGHRVAATEEEGIYGGNPMQSLRDADLFLAWGELERSKAEATGLLDPTKIFPTGNPRFDLLRPELRAIHARGAAELVERHGRYLLVNTNFVTNAVFGIDRLAAVNQQDAEAFDVPVDYFDAIERHSKEMLDHFVVMIEAVARHFPDHRVILRPHPIEDQDWWRSTLRHLPNAHVEFTGTVLPWILGADAVVHNSCTTGIEAHLLGASVFAYVPPTSGTYEWSLPNDVSRQVPDLDGLLQGLEAAVAAADDGQRLPSVGTEVLAPHVASLTGPLAAERMMDALEPFGRPSALGWTPGRRWAARADSRLMLAKHAVNLALRRTRVPLSFERTKNPGWDAVEVEGVLAELRRATGRFEGTTAVALVDDVVAIVPGRKAGVRD